MKDIQNSESLYWYVHDADGRETHGMKSDIPAACIKKVEKCLERVNPSVGKLKQMKKLGSQNVELHLQYSPVSGDMAAGSCGLAS